MIWTTGRRSATQGRFGVGIRQQQSLECRHGELSRLALGPRRVLQASRTVPLPIHLFARRTSCESIAKARDTL